MSAGKLGDLLLQNGLVTQEQLKLAIEHKGRSKGRLSSSLVSLRFVKEKVLATFLSKQFGIPAISLDDVQVPKEVANLIPISLCEKHMMVPLSVENNRLSVAVSDPTNVAAIDDVRFLCNMDVNVYLSTEGGIKDLIGRAYQNQSSLANEMKNDDLKLEDEKTGLIEIGQQASAQDIGDNGAGEKPVIKLINKVLLEAVRRKASDIHMEPFYDHARIRFRIDGSLHEIMKVPPALKTAIPARVKVMSQLDISERRLPQDGRIQIRTQDRKIDIRVSLLPTVFGEKVVMRLLDAGTASPTLAGIGFEEEQLKLFKKATSQPYGLILVTGPTGSGKSTTLFGAIAELNGPDINISTVEDPVEYNMAGVNQTMTRESIGLTFASALRSLLRQDPDVVMVGEIRDAETAEIAIKAALTGHMVFSTLHTNDAPSTITRLIHMGIEPFLITAALSLVQAQRLLRVNCEKCNEPDEKVTEKMLIEAELPEHWVETVKPMRGRGCHYCGNTGYKGRRGIFEVMQMTERLREMVIKGANADALKKVCLEEGMISLRQSGLLKLYRGETTLEEVLNNSRPDGDLKK